MRGHPFPPESEPVIPPSLRRTWRPLLLLLLSLAGVVAASAEPSVRQPRLEDFIAEPGSRQQFQPFMLHADLWVGIDQRAKLDSIVFVLDNGARACRVMNRDSTWAVDYTWVYPHDRFPPRWYDARSLIRTGDSLRLEDAADIRLTFGTLRTAVHAGNLAQATAEAYRHWPTTIPPALQGRLKLKLDRAKKALRGEKDSEPTFPPH
jgi:hypothetical protein